MEKIHKRIYIREDMWASSAKGCVQACSAPIVASHVGMSSAMSCLPLLRKTKNGPLVEEDELVLAFFILVPDYFLELHMNLGWSRSSLKQVCWSLDSR